jgi:uncharacterized protein YfaS (alpha-2-macroglobulin family)
MRTTEFNFRANQGDTFRATLLVETTFSLTGKTGKMQVRAGENYPVALEFTTANATMTLGALVTRTVNGAQREFREVALYQAASTMAGVKSNKYQYDLQFADGADTTTLLRGSFDVKPQITR